MTQKRRHLYRKPDPRDPDLVRVYFRHPKTGELTRLPDDENSKAFTEQYDLLFAALNAPPVAPAPPDPHARTKRETGDGGIEYMPGMLGWFVTRYLASSYFEAGHRDCYAEGTRYNYRKALDLLKARLGRGLFVDLDQEAVEVHCAEVADEHGDSAADDQIAMVSNLWKFAAKKFPADFKRKGRMNPTYRIERHYRHDGEGHLAWPEDVIEAFDTDCPWHLEFVRMGLHYTGQRGGDVASMKWTDFDGKRIHVVQEKTGKKLWLNCPKPLLVALKREQRKTNREYIFHHAYDAPFANAQTLSHAIRNRLEALGINKPPAEREAGVKNFTMHGLRKNAGMELAEAGAEVMEIMSVLGHKTPKMAMFYCEQARQARINENAVAKWDAAIEANEARKAVAKREAVARRRGSIRAVA